MRRILALLLLLPAPVAAQTLATPLNNAESTLAQNHASGSGTLVLQAGDGDQFGTPSPSAPIRVTVAARSTLVNGQIRRHTTQTIFLVTGRDTDTLTGLTAVEGTSDRAYRKDDPVVAVITAGAISDIQTALSTLPVDTSVLHKTANESKTGQLSLKAPDGSTAPLVVKDNADTTIHSVGVDGKHALSINRLDGHVLELANRYSGGGYGATTIPFRMRNWGNDVAGTIDNQFTLGWDIVPGTANGLHEGWEHRWLNQGTGHEQDERYFQIDPLNGDPSWRSYYWFLDTTLNQATWQGLGYTWTWAGRTTPGTPLLSVFTNDDNTGTVTVSNAGTSPPLNVAGTSANVNVTLNSDQQLALNSVQAADGTNTTRNGVGVSSTGAYWNGSASVGAESSLKTVVTGNNAFHAALSAGNATMRFTESGNLGPDVAASFLDQPLVLKNGYVAMLGAALPADVKYRLVGLVGTPGAEQLSIDPDDRGLKLGPGWSLLSNDLGDGLTSVVTFGNASPTIAGVFSRKLAAQTFYIGLNAANSGGLVHQGGGITQAGLSAGGTSYVMIQNQAGNATANHARLYMAPVGGFTTAFSPYIEAYNTGVDGATGFRVVTYDSSTGLLTTALDVAPTGVTTFSKPPVLPSVADASAPNGSIFWSTTTAGKLKAKAPDGTLSTLNP